MRTLLGLALLPAVLLLQACPLAATCGGFEGGDDTVMRRENGDALILCGNGGYAVMRASGQILEGRHQTKQEASGAVLSGSNGETGAQAFELAQLEDGTWTSTELGAGWIAVELDAVELDHAHVQCTDLETRAWFGPSDDALPVATAFERPVAGFDSVAACLEGQAEGSVPADTRCSEEMLLCPDNSVVTASRARATYTAHAGRISLFGENVEHGTYLPERLAVPGKTWTQIATHQLLATLRCE